MISDTLLNYLWRTVPDRAAVWEQIDRALEQLDSVLAYEGCLSGRASALADELSALAGELSALEGANETAVSTARNNIALERVSVALGAYPDSDLASLANTLRRRNAALEAVLRDCAAAASRLLDE